MEIKEQLFVEKFDDGSPRYCVRFLGQRDVLVGFFKEHSGEKVSVYIDDIEISSQRVGSATLFGSSDSGESKSFALVVIPKNPASLCDVMRKYGASCQLHLKEK